MKVTFILSDEFLRQFKRLAKKYSSLVNDYGILKKELCKNPFQGDDLGNGVSKVRMSISSKARVKVVVLASSLSMSFSMKMKPLRLPC